jgi:hypothetical protein
MERRTSTCLDKRRRHPRRAAEQISFAAAETAARLRFFPPMRALSGKYSSKGTN